MEIQTMIDKGGLVNSPKNLVELSKARKLDDARRNWNGGQKLPTLSPSGTHLPSIHTSESASPTLKMRQN
jgi:hypothetical protein